VGRAHLFEFHDLPWFPAVWRGLLTDFLSFFARAFKPYAGVAPVLGDAVQRAGARRIVDLCSGAGGPVLSIAPALREGGVSGLAIVLTDKYPHVAAWAVLGNAEGFTVTFESCPVDALDVPEHLTGFRTLFTSFHHFAPSEARKILEDAAAKNQGIGIFEYTERTWWLWSLPVMLIPLVVWVVTPFIRPFSWRRLVWTYLLPVVPAVAQWDGFVSCLRSYSIDELRGLIEGVGDASYRWEIGRVPSRGLSRVTYIVGLPGDRVE
jgi:hypothetical protein